MRATALHLLLLLVLPVLPGCMAFVKNRLGTTVQATGGYDDPKGPDLVFFELHGVAGFGEGLYALAVPEDWGARPWAWPEGADWPRLDPLLEGGLTAIPSNHPSEPERESASLAALPSWTSADRPLRVRMLREKELTRAPPKADPPPFDYAVRVREDGHWRRVELYAAGEDEWVLMQELSLESRRKGWWGVARTLAMPFAFLTDFVVQAGPYLGMGYLMVAGA